MLNPCGLCKAECCKNYIITITSFDLLQIREKTKKKPGEFVLLAPVNLLNYDNDTVLECYEEENVPGGGREMLRYDYVLALKSHPCYFLDKNDCCTIHDIAPLCCRLYPHNPNKGLMQRALCPFTSKLLFRMKKPRSIAQNYINQLDTYKKIVAKWNKLHKNRKNCLDFLLKESERILANNLNLG